MCKNNRIDFIDINNAFQRKELLKKYASKPINISQIQYKKTLTDNKLMMKFLN